MAKKEFDKQGNELKTLNLIIKQQYFNAIADGRKKEEYREIKPTNEKKLIELDENGYAIEDENGNSVPIKYDALRLFVGYNKDRDTMLVRVNNAYTQIIVDENGEPLAYEVDGEPYLVEQVVYELGEIIECVNSHKIK